MRFRSIGAVVAALALLAGCGPGPLPEVPTDEPEPTTGEPVPGEAPRATLDLGADPGGGPYRIRCGDVLEISVSGDPGTLKTLPVRPDGRISYLFVGEVEAAGRTFEDLQQEIVGRLRDGQFYRDPAVAVIGVQFTGNTISVLGAVRTPGRLVLTQETLLMDAIAQAGGFTKENVQGVEVDMADLASAVLVRDNRVLDVDFRTLFGPDGPDLRQNVPVRGGDLIYVPSNRSRLVYVLGEVGSPRTVRHFEGLTALGAVAECGGVTVRASARNGVLVRGGLRSPEAYRLNLARIQVGRDRDVALQPGDIVYVPTSALSRLEQVSARLIPVFNAVVQADQARGVMEREFEREFRLR